LALNRTGQWSRAEVILKDVLEKHGPSSETYGILGRVYKDLWKEAKDRQDAPLATQFLDEAINAYLKGFETDWRDPYPGVNAVTLMTIREPPDPRRSETLPVVLYAVKRRLAGGTADYWDLATLLELHVLMGDAQEAQAILPQLIRQVRRGWEVESTANQLRTIREALEKRHEATAWLEGVENQLNALKPI
jgi:hypothetical protein